MKKLILWIAIAAECAAEPTPSKSDYNLFNPTPEAQMREFATDRPDKTEAAYTVDAGHFQHETDILNYVRNSSDGATSQSLLMMAPNLKVGLTNSSDLQLIVQPFVYGRTEVEEGGSEKLSGLGDIFVRFKQNIWGNDGGDTALAVMPYLKFPTNRGDLGNTSVEGGVIVPFALALDEEWGLGLMTQYDILQKDDGDGHFVQFVNTITAGRSLTDYIGFYVELWSAASNEDGHQVTLDGGLTYSLYENTQFDIGLNTGLTDHADDLNPFIGISQRF